jgi:hypothetical protein
VTLPVRPPRPPLATTLKPSPRSNHYHARTITTLGPSPAHLATPVVLCRAWTVVSACGAWQWRQSIWQRTPTTCATTWVRSVGRAGGSYMQWVQGADATAAAAAQGGGAVWCQQLCRTVVHCGTGSSSGVVQAGAKEGRGTRSSMAQAPAAAAAGASSSGHSRPQQQPQQALAAAAPTGASSRWRRQDDGTCCGLAQAQTAAAQRPQQVPAAPAQQWCRKSAGASSSYTAPTTVTQAAAPHWQQQLIAR